MVRFRGRGYICILRKKSLECASKASSVPRKSLECANGDASHCFLPDILVLHTFGISARRWREWHLKRHDLTGCGEHPLPCKTPPWGGDWAPPIGPQAPPFDSSRHGEHEDTPCCRAIFPPRPRAARQSSRLRALCRKPKDAIKTYMSQARRPVSLLPGMLSSRRLHPHLARNTLYPRTCSSWQGDSWAKI